MSLINIEGIIQSTIRTIESNSDINIRLKANGGNSILIVCEPKKEIEYISEIQRIMRSNKYEIIDINQLLCKFVEENKETIEESFELLKSSTYQIFKAPVGEEGTDLFGLILDNISKAYDDNKIPVLIKSGSLQGTEIENVHIMESEIVMKATLPLVILYPATHENGSLMFLGVRPASKYRCMIID